MKKLLLLLLAIPAVMLAQTTTFTATFPFDSVRNNTGRVDPTPLPVVNGLMFDSVRSFGASANSSASVRFSFTGWPTGATQGNGTYADLTGSVDPAKYYEFEIIPDLGVISAYTVDSIEFRFQRSGTGVRTYIVRGGADAFATNLTAGVVPANPKINVEADNVFYFNVDSTSGQNGSKIYPGSAYANLTTPSVFRFYGYNAEATTGTFSIDNVVIHGTTTLITSVAKSNTTKFMLFPNPVNEGAVTLTGHAGEKNIEVFDVTGNLVVKVSGSSSRIDIPVTALAAGTYFIRIHSLEGINTLKFKKN